MSASEVRAAFGEQATWCARLGSPFTALLCRTLAERLSDASAVERSVLGWRGNPFAQADALALRVCGALHALARANQVPGLSALYPPAPSPPPEVLWEAIRAAFEQHESHFEKFLATAPQTNEVGRSAVLMCGFLAIARRTELPLHLFEIGASAGLNLIPDRYRYRFGERHWGRDAASPLLTPTWTGAPPPVQAPFQVAGRRGSDIAPLDLSSSDERARLSAYVWPDQTDRLSLLEAALATARQDPPRLERMDAAAWVEQNLCRSDAPARTVQVLYHSILWHYLTEEGRNRITAHMERCGAQATSERPLAWLRFELDEASPPASLRLRLWPTGEEMLIARAQPHGQAITYLSG